MMPGMKTGIATGAVLLGLLVANDRASQGQTGAARPTPRPATAQAASPNAQTASPNAQTAPARPVPGPATAGTSGAAPAAAPRSAIQTPVASHKALIDQYCLTCHSDRVKSGGLALSALN